LVSHHPHVYGIRRSFVGSLSGSELLVVESDLLWSTTNFNFEFLSAVEVDGSIFGLNWVLSIDESEDRNRFHFFASGVLEDLENKVIEIVHHSEGLVSVFEFFCKHKTGQFGLKLTSEKIGIVIIFIDARSNIKSFIHFSI